MINALPYYGGKGRTRINRWLQSMLPPGGQPYVEPFGGMLSVLINRQPATTEIAGDENHAIMAWWECVRDHPEELRRRILHTPLHRGIYRQAHDTLFGAAACDADLLDRGWAATVMISDGIQHTACAGQPPSHWVPRYSSISGGILRREVLADRIPVLATRMRDVYLDDRGAVSMLTRIARCRGAIVYCDPPYHDYADVSPYGTSPIDRGDMRTLLLAQTGRVAISGYGDAWDDLGWQRHELMTSTRQMASRKRRSPRTEVLWTSYDAPHGCATG